VFISVETDCPSLIHLHNHVVQSVAPKWKDLGVQLSISPNVLDIINANCPNDVEKSCKLMLDKWLNTQKSASWNQLLKALCAIGKDHLASVIQGKLKGESV